MSFESENNRLVDRLVSAGYLRSPDVETAFRSTPRHLFVPDDLVSSSYADTPLPIGFGQTISAPHMVAIMTEALGARKNSRILEVGAGSGYQAAVLARIAFEGVVHTVERVKGLSELARENLEKAGVKNVFVHDGDGTLGFPSEAPYDRIIVTAGAPRVPKALLGQLSDGGRLLAPVGGRMVQELVSVEKRGGMFSQKNLGGCVFVPLVGEDGW